MQIKTAAVLAALGLFAAGTPPAHAGPVAGTVQVSGKADLRDVVVYVEGVRSTFRAPKPRPEINHVELRFVPRTLAVLKGTTVAFPNSDSVLHSAFSLSRSNPFDLGIYGQGKVKTVTFANPGLVEIFCHIHSGMRAFVLVLDNPYFTAVSADGRFAIPDVPDGTYSVKAWAPPARHETRRVTVRGPTGATVSFALEAE